MVSTGLPGSPKRQRGDCGSPRQSATAEPLRGSPRIPVARAPGFLTKRGDMGPEIPPLWRTAVDGGQTGGYSLGLREPENRAGRIDHESGVRMVKLTVRDRESIQEAVRRFRKLVERSGIKKEMRKREFFEKPSETRRRARLRAERRTKRNRLLGV